MAAKIDPRVRRMNELRSLIAVRVRLMHSPRAGLGYNGTAVSAQAIADAKASLTRSLDTLRAELAALTEPSSEGGPCACDACREGDGH